MPQELLTCKESPAVPNNTNNSRSVAVYIVDLHTAHADCQSKLGAVRKALNE